MRLPRSAALLFVAGLALAPMTGATIGERQANSAESAAAALAPDATYPLFDPFDYSDVVLLGNNNSLTSRNLTAHFQQVHAMADDHVFLADLPVAETITSAVWTGFASWFTSEMSNRSLGPGINYIVTFKGVPIRVAWSGPNGATSFQDALMLLGGSYASYIGSANLWGNPYFNQTERFSFAQFGLRLVTGIYAYNESTAMALIDRAASSLGSRGEFVLDSDSSKGYGGGWGTYGYANAALLWANASLAAAGEPVFMNTNTTYVTGRANVIGYSSWGSNDCCWGSVTQNAKPQNTWVNGSIGETFVSTGGRTFTWPPSYGQSLIADWIDEGINGIKGYTDEPYISAIADGHILFGRYIQGYNMAESFWAASHVVGWRQIVIGDPKMAPFYPQERDFAVNATLTRAPAWAEEGSLVNVSLGVDNTGMWSEEVQAEVRVDGTLLFNGTLSAPAFAASSFDLVLNLSALGPTVWGDLTLDLALDADGLIAERNESNNNGSVPIELRRAPVVGLAAERPSVLTFEPANLTMGALRADRLIDHFEVVLDEAGNLSTFNLSATGDSASYAASYPRSGVRGFSVWAVDVAGIRSRSPATVSVEVLNRAPVATAWAETPSPLTLENVTFNASTSTDLDGVVVSYLWEHIGRGFVAPEALGDGPVFVMSFLRPGNYTIVLTVTDNEGATAQTYVLGTVGNRAPFAGVAANASSVLTLVPLGISGMASDDPDGDIRSYRFLFDDGTVVTQPTWNTSHAFLRPGPSGLWLEVTDDWGATSRARLSLEVLNRAPLVSWSAEANFTAVEGLSWSLLADLEDLDNNLTSYNADFGDGSHTFGPLSGSGRPLALPHGYGLEGDYSLTLVVVDEWGAQTTLQAPVMVVHPAPFASTFSLTAEGLNISLAYAVESPYAQLTLTVKLDGRVIRTVDITAPGNLDLSLPTSTVPGNHTVLVEVDDGSKTVELGSTTWQVPEPAAPPCDCQPPPTTEPSSGVGLFVLAGGIGAAGLGLVLLFRRRRAK